MDIFTKEEATLIIVEAARAWRKKLLADGDDAGNLAAHAIWTAIEIFEGRGD